MQQRSMLAALVLVLLCRGGGSSTPRKFSFREYSVVPCLGKYMVPPASSVAACFLGPSQMEAVALEDVATEEGVVFERRVLRNLIPVPLLRQDVEQAIEQSMPGRVVDATASSSIQPSVLTERDGGLFDSVRFVFSQGGQIGTAERLDALLGRSNNANPTPAMAVSSSSVVMKSLRAVTANGATPYQGLLKALFEVLGLRVRGLLIEVADRPSDSSIFVGGAVLLGVEREEDEEEEEEGTEWTADTALELIRQTQQSTLCSQVGFFLKTYPDEVVGLSLALGPDQMPIVVSRAISEQLEMDVLLQQQKRRRGTEDVRPTMLGPFFPSKAAKEEWMQSSGGDAGKQQQQQEQKQGQQQEKEKENEKDQQQPQPPQSQPMLLDATTFLTMRPSERRAWLRAQTSGSSSAMPRPREGTLALNAACYACMDINVVYEVLRRLAESSGDEAAAAARQDFESLKPGLAKDILVAQAAGDVDAVRELTARLQACSTLPYHPFRPNLVSVEEDGFDVEEWYFTESRSLQGQRNIG